MTQHRTRPHRLRRAGALGALTAALVVLPAATAAADTSTATAAALNATLLNGALDVGTTTAASDGTADVAQPTTTPLLGSQSTVTAGLVVQRAIAYADGTSVACAGLIGAGGTVQLGKDGSCTPSGAASGGVVIDLGVVKIKADAVLARCRASSDGTATASAQLVNAAISTPLSSAALLAAPGANTTLANVLGLVTAKLNAQSVPSGAGSVRATALDVAVLGTVVGIRVGTVSCGQNVKVLPTPVLPLQGLPLTAGVLAVAGLVAHRRGLLPGRTRPTAVGR